MTKRYGAIRGIEQVDLCVQAGECFGFIGPNGAGKSTLIRCLLGLIAPTSGSARVLGLEVGKDQQKILSQVGYLPSETAFWRGMRAGEVIRLSAALRGKRCDEEADTLCQRLNVDPTRKVEDLSLGNRKKVALVCALQHRPRLYILDEPTSGLDPLAQRTFFSLLEERRAEGATVFLSSHVLTEIQRHCDRAAFLRAGRIIACDTVQALTHGSTRRVTLRSDSPLPELPGMRGLRREGTSASFLYSGPLVLLTSALARMALQELSVAEPDLEELFLHCYGAEGGTKA